MPLKAESLPPVDADENRPEVLRGWLLAPGSSDHAEDVPRVVDLAPLVRCSLEVPGDSRFEAFLVVRDTQLDPFEPPSFERPEYLLVGRLPPGVCDLHPEDPLKPSSHTAETTGTPWLTTRPSTLTFS
jgi:hypothetical protein